MIFDLFQEDCEARGAILYESNSQAVVDAVNALFNISK